MTGVKRSMMAAAGAAGGGGDPLYVEDVFSTYVYEGTGSTLAINNGIDLDEEGGLVWIKNRSTASRYHALYDTERGVQDELNSNDSREEQTGENQGLTAFNSNGFSVGNRSYVGTDDDKYVSWTFRKAPGFFDVVTYTGTGSARTVAHDLGSVPGCIMIKDIANNAHWFVYHVNAHASAPEDWHMRLNTSNSPMQDAAKMGTLPTSTVFSVGDSINTSGRSYVAYLFANNDQSFGTGSDESIIKCGSFTRPDNDANNFIAETLGWEPEWILWKTINEDGNWLMFDTMRGMDYDTTEYLKADDHIAEQTSNDHKLAPTPTGFEYRDNNANTEVYIAIRRPMKTPEAGTEVFFSEFKAPGSGEQYINTGHLVDTVWYGKAAGAGMVLGDRLRGVKGGGDLMTASGDALNTNANGPFSLDHNIGGTWRTSGGWNVSPVATDENYWRLYFKRAPGFYETVTYEGNDAADRGVAHGLGVAPEFYMVKSLSRAQDWKCWHKDLSNNDMTLRLDNASAETENSIIFGGNAPTSTVFYVDDTGNHMVTNNSGDNYMAYMWATIEGVSKVGTYTADASLTTIDCDFAAGARFILIKRIDASGDWYIWNTSRGIVSGNDPYRLLNSQSAEVTNTDYIDPHNDGFQITAAGSSTININTAKYIFIAIA